MGVLLNMPDMTPEERIRELEEQLARLNEVMKKAEHFAKLPFGTSKELENAASELRLLKGTTNEDGMDYETYLIDWVNANRGAIFQYLNELPDEELVLIGKIYETSYRVSVAVLTNRNVKIKISKRDEFQAALDTEKKHKLERETAKASSRRKTPEETMIETMMGLGMTRSQAEAQVATIKNIGK